MRAGPTPVSGREPSRTFREMSAHLRKTLALRYTGFFSWAWDIRSDTVDADPDLARLFDMPDHRQTITSADIRARMHAADRPRMDAAMARTIATGAPCDERFRIVDREGTVRWLRGICEVHESDADGTASVIVGLNMDITDQVAGEERMLAIVGEMRHRIRNSLAMVNSLVAATARETEDVAEYADKLRGRIDALAAAQRAIGNTDDVNLVSLGEAVHGALAPFVGTASWGHRIRIDVCDLPVPPSLGQAIALTVYEFATNAIKHGALSFDDGTIDVTAGLSDDRRLLELEWSECHAGRQTRPPSGSSGFGTQLVDRLIRAENGEIERTLDCGMYRANLRFQLTG